MIAKDTLLISLGYQSSRGTGMMLVSYGILAIKMDNNSININK